MGTKLFRYFTYLANMVAVAAAFFSGLGFYGLFFLMLPFLAALFEAWGTRTARGLTHLLRGKALGALLGAAVGAVLLSLAAINTLSLITACALAMLSLLACEVLVIFIGSLVVLRGTQEKGRPSWKAILINIISHVFIGYGVQKEGISHSTKDAQQKILQRRFLNTALLLLLSTMVFTALTFITLYFKAPFMVIVPCIVITAYMALSVVVCTVQSVLQVRTGCRRGGSAGKMLFGLASFAAVMIVVGAFSGDQVIATLGFANLSFAASIAPIGVLATVVSGVMVVALLGLCLLKYDQKTADLYRTTPEVAMTPQDAVAQNNVGLGGGEEFVQPRPISQVGVELSHAKTRAVDNADDALSCVVIPMQ